ncbi:MAG: shikimate kinase [Bacillota bacterium]
MVITLIGMMGSGKSTVGQILSSDLDFNFYDTDLLIEQKTDQEINEIFALAGEDYFRQVEKQIIAELYESLNDEEAVVAVGGGAVLSARNREKFLLAGPVFWLHVPPEKLASRLLANKDRPLIADLNRDMVKLKTYLAGLLEERANYYQIGVKLDAGKKPEQIVKKIREVSF